MVKRDASPDWVLKPRPARTGRLNDHIWACGQEQVDAQKTKRAASHDWVFEPKTRQDWASEWSSGLEWASRIGPREQQAWTGS